MARLSTYGSSVVLELSMAAEDPRAVDQISRTAFQKQQALFIVTALRLARLSVNISHDALDHVNLKSRKETFVISQK